MLTLALATILVLTVASLALLFWPEEAPPALEEGGGQEAEDGLITVDGD